MKKLYCLLFVSIFLTSCIKVDKIRIKQINGPGIKSIKIYDWETPPFTVGDTLPDEDNCRYCIGTDTPKGNFIVVEVYKEYQTIFE